MCVAAIIGIRHYILQYMDNNMRILTALLCVWLAADGLDMASLNKNKQDVEYRYIQLEGRLCLEFPRDTKSNSKLSLRKQLPSGQQQKVAEWDRTSSPAKETVFIRTYEGRTELDEEPRVIGIRNMTMEDNGVYYILIDQTPGGKPYNVVVIKDVPKPSVVHRPPCAPPQSAACLLVCEGNVTDAGPLTYRWKKDGGEWTVPDARQNLSITDDEEWKKVEKVFCEMKNPVSAAQSDPSDNPFYLKGNPPATTGVIVGGIIGGIVLILAVGLVVKYRDGIKGVLPSCGSKPGVSEATNASSQRNENEVPLLHVPLKKEESTSQSDNNLHSTNVMDLINAVSSRATSLCTLCEEVEGNKKQCQHLAQRVKELDELVQALKQKGAGQNSDDVEVVLRDVSETLEAAKDVVKHYLSADTSHEHVFKDYNDGGEFARLNVRLTNALNKLFKALQVAHDDKIDMLFNEDSQREEDEADRREDHEELKRIMDLIHPISAKAASLSPLCEGAMRNKDRREGLVERVNVLEECLGAIKENGPGPNSAAVEEALREVQTTLESDDVAAFVEKYTSTRTATDFGNEFGSLNNGLGNALNKLSSALPVNSYKRFEQDPRYAEDEALREEEWTMVTSEGGQIHTVSMRH